MAGAVLLTENERRYFAVYNDSGEEIPPLSFVTPTSMAYNGGIVVDQVSVTGDKMAMVTSEAPIPDETWGLATRDWPAPVQYDSADGTPAAQAIEEWGPKAGFWAAKKSVAGWKLIGPYQAGMETLGPGDVDAVALIEIEVCRSG